MSADVYNSPVAILRVPARREREYEALRILGHLRRPDGTVRPGTDDQMKEARRWRMIS